MGSQGDAVAGLSADDDVADCLWKEWVGSPSMTSAEAANLTPFDAAAVNEGVMRVPKSVRQKGLGSTICPVGEVTVVG